MANKDKLISLVVPVYNESEGIEHFHSSLVKVMKKLSYRYEVLYIDDGSIDLSLEKLEKLQSKDATVRVIALAKNFGKEMTTTAGLHNASGECAVIIDADGQHPVELIPDFIKKWEQGADVVIGIRTSNMKEGFIKRNGSRLFYYILRFIGVNDAQPRSTDFRLVDRQVIDEFKRVREHNRITRSLIDWLGYKRSYIEFSAKERQFGEASYSVRKLTQLAFNGFVSLSFTPLYIAGYLGIAITLLSLFGTLFILVERFILGDPLLLNISGTALLALLVIFLVGVLLTCQGLLSIYIARIYTETQDRPLYIIRKSRK